MLHLIWSIIIGFIVGLCARAIMPGMQHLTFIMTTLLGIGGSIVGGLLLFVKQLRWEGALLVAAPGL